MNIHFLKINFKTFDDIFRTPIDEKRKTRIILQLIIKTLSIKLIFFILVKIIYNHK